MWRCASPADSNEQEMALDSIKEVEIDDDETFKYVLLELKDKKGRAKIVVRGFEWAQYHADIVDRVAPKFSEQGVTYECKGGGRIKHDCSKKSIFVYGYSVDYGQADHQTTVDILQRNFPQYSKNNIAFSNSGY